MRGVEKTYRAAGRGTSGVRANAGVDLDVPTGELFGLLGPNGAGKSTLVRQLVGLARPDRGSIELFGHDLLADPRRAAGYVAYLAQDEAALSELPVGLAVETTARL
ncbi:MAG: type transport system ATP-binding protein, partial [Frankiaceae bacterium]|nr:type transport system ATP-binding protein [Frankiaceae bacterium]